MKLSPLEKLEVEARRLLRVIDDIDRGVKRIKEVSVSETLIKEHVRRAHTRCITVKINGKSRNRVKIDGKFKGRVKADLSF